MLKKLIRKWAGTADLEMRIKSLENEGWHLRRVVRDGNAARAMDRDVAITAARETIEHHINSERFLDDVVERIRRKQL